MARPPAVVAHVVAVDHREVPYELVVLVLADLVFGTSSFFGGSGVYRRGDGLLPARAPAPAPAAPAPAAIAASPLPRPPVPLHDLLPVQSIHFLEGVDGYEYRSRGGVYDVVVVPQPQGVQYRRLVEVREAYEVVRPVGAVAVVLVADPDLGRQSPAAAVAVAVAVVVSADGLPAVDAQDVLEGGDRSGVTVGVAGREIPRPSLLVEGAPAAAAAVSAAAAGLDGMMAISAAAAIPPVGGEAGIVPQRQLEGGQAPRNDDLGAVVDHRGDPTPPGARRPEPHRLTLLHIMYITVCYYLVLCMC